MFCWRELIAGFGQRPPQFRVLCPKISDFLIKIVIVGVRIFQCRPQRIHFLRRRNRRDKLPAVFVRYFRRHVL